MSSATQAVVFNAVPLFVLAASYAAVAGSVLPTLWRMRGRAHLADWGLALVFPAVSIAAAIFGVLVVREERPVGGHVWLSFVAILVALIPAALLLLRGRERSALAAGMGRTIAAEERVSMRDRELESVTALSAQLVRAHREIDVAKPLVRQVVELLGVGFASVTLVDESGDTARGLYGERNGEPFEWWSSVTVDLRNEPSGIASAVFDAAPVTVYDVAGSPLVNKSLANRVGAKSGTFVPMIAETRVIGVLTAASTAERRAFSPEELALLRAVAAEAALALARLSSASALAEALGREQTAAAIARRLRAEHEPAAVAAVAESELRAELGLDRCEVVLGDDSLEGTPVEAGDERVATLVTQRGTPLAPAEELMLEAVARELGSALQTARLLVENERRLEQQQALLRASQVVTGELSPEAVLRRLVEQVTFRCAAVHGFDSSLVGFEFVPEGLPEGALRSPVALGPEQERALAGPIPSPAYAGFSRSLVAPMTWSGETLGVIGVGVRDGRRAFASDDVELLAAFASLAALALRNAESYEASIRQARVQRGFYRIAALLGESLSLSETYDATAHAAAGSACRTSYVIWRCRRRSPRPPPAGTSSRPRRSSATSGSPARGRRARSRRCSAFRCRSIAPAASCSCASASGASSCGTISSSRSRSRAPRAERSSAAVSSRRSGPHVHCRSDSRGRAGCSPVSSTLRRCSRPPPAKRSSCSPPTRRRFRCSTATSSSSWQPRATRRGLRSAVACRRRPGRPARCSRRALRSLMQRSTSVRPATSECR